MTTLGNRSITTLFGLVLAATLAASCTGGLPEEFPAPDFTMDDLLTGKEIRLADYHGRPVLLYFFASW